MILEKKKPEKIFDDATKVLKIFFPRKDEEKQNEMQNNFIPSILLSQYVFLLSLLMMFLLLLLSNNSSREHQKKEKKILRWKLFLSFHRHLPSVLSHKLFFPEKQIGGNYSPNIDRREKISFLSVTLCFYGSCPVIVTLEIGI